MHLRSATMIVMLALAAAPPASFWGLDDGSSEPVPVGHRITVYEASHDQVRLVRWAIARFERARLGAPLVEVHFHHDREACRGHLGVASLGRVDVCTTLVNAMTRRVLLHEMAHIWLDEHISASVKARFLDARGVRTWNAAGIPWPERGYEQGAEIVAWVLGEGILTPQIPNNEPEKVASAYELLTGHRPPLRASLSRGWQDTSASSGSAGEISRANRSARAPTHEVAAGAVQRRRRPWMIEEFIRGNGASTSAAPTRVTTASGRPLAL